MASGSNRSLGSYTDLLCTDHRKPLLFYCKTCTKRICGYCVTGSHKEHDFVNADIEGEQLSMEYDNDADTESVSSYTSNNITDISEPPTYEESWAKDIYSNETDEQLKAFKKDISCLQQEMHQYVEKAMSKTLSEAMSTFDHKLDNRCRAFILQNKGNKSKPKETQPPSMKSNSNLERINKTSSKSYQNIKHVKSYQFSEMYQQNQNQNPKQYDTGFPQNRLIPSRQQNMEVQLLRQRSISNIPQIHRTKAFDYYPATPTEDSKSEKFHLPPLITKVLLLQSVPKEVKSTNDGILCFCDTDLVGGYPQTEVLKMMDVAQTVMNIIVFNDAIAAPHCIAIHPTNNQLYCVTLILKEPKNSCIVNSVDTQTGHARKLFDTKEQLNCLAITKHGLILAGSNNTLLVYKTTGERLQKVKCKLRLHHISVCKSTGLVACCADGAVQVMDEHYEDKRPMGLNSLT